MARHFKQQQPENESRAARSYQPQNIYEGKPAKKPRKRKGGGILSTLLIVVGVALLAAAAFMWVQAQLRYRKVRENNEALAAYVKVQDVDDGDGSGEKSNAPEVDWEGLKAVNQDVVGWLQIPDTEVNYPVYQSEDNEKYLHTTASGEYTVGGQLFVDHLCTKPGMVDPSTLIYGHHLIDGTMFMTIAEMDQQERFDQVDTVWYVTEENAYECEPLFTYCTDSDDQKVRSFTFTSDEEFHEYLKERYSKAWAKRADAEQILPVAQHVLCLITCNYYKEFDGYGRTILVCVPKDEAAKAKEATS